MAKRKASEKKQTKNTVEPKGKTNSSSNNYTKIIIGVVVIVILAVILATQLFKTTVKDGDTVKFDYVLKLQDGTVYDTSIKSIGDAAGLPKPQYQAIEIKLGQGALIPGVEKALVGMAKEQKKTITVRPEEGYGLVSEDQILKGLKRLIDSKKYSVIDKATFKTAFGKDPLIGEVFTRPELPWKINITAANETSVTLGAVVNVGEEIHLPGAQWDAVIRSVTDDSVVIYQSPILDSRVSFPTTSGIVTGKVIRVDDTSFDVDTNHPLAGKTLTFELTLVDITTK